MPTIDFLVVPDGQLINGRSIIKAANRRGGDPWWLWAPSPTDQIISWRNSAGQSHQQIQGQGLEIFCADVERSRTN